MKEYTCIVCPEWLLAPLRRNDQYLHGQPLPPRRQIRRKRVHNPVRSVTSTVKTSVPGYPVISVRTSRDPKRAGHGGLMGNQQSHHQRLSANQFRRHQNILNTGADIITTAPMKKGK
jgi:CxxC motif-containing protein